ncbi:MAG: sodium:alanine symporter family protein [Clostridia bacterium]|nr:sodium:alanine symporter family protein [Clostridia bacterium]
MLDMIRNALWGMPLIGLLLSFGGYFTVKTRFLPLRLWGVLKRTVGSLPRGKDGKALLRAVATALGGTVGIGSITGVAYGIAVGGAGSVFWMWVSGLGGMALKYAEVFLAVKHRKQTENGYVGGAPYILRDLGHPKTGVCFALLCVLASFGVGNLTQIGALTETASAMGISPLLCGGVCGLLLAYCLWGGRERIGRWNGVLVPAASFLYVAVTAWVVLTHASALPDALGRILAGAFGIRPLAGGVSGSLIAASMREGFARGVFSNEAGVGSSPLAHAASGEGDPRRQGEWGIFEVFADTFLVSTLTALALLVTGENSIHALFAPMLWGWGSGLFALLSAVFAFASILSWCYYSRVCLQFLRLPAGETVYSLCSVVCAFLGALLPLESLLTLADVLGGVMIFPNLFLLFKLRERVK